MRKVSISGSNAENFSEIKIHCFVFKDSMSFCSNSLENLAEKHRERVGKFDILKSHDICKTKSGHFSQAKYDILSSGKSPFPYDYVTDLKVLFEKQLPSQQAFYNKLKDKHLSDEDYAWAQDIWREFECETFGDYLAVYLKLDTLLLADVMRDFSNKCGKNFGLYPEHFR